MTASEQIAAAIESLDAGELLGLLLKVANQRNWVVVTYNEDDVGEYVASPARRVPMERWDELVQRVMAQEAWPGLGDILIDRGGDYLSDLVDRVVEEVLPSDLEAPCGSG